MSSIIVYGSHYGSARRYAEQLGELTGITVVDCQKVKDLDYDVVVHIGALYSGKILGITNVLKTIRTKTRLILATVGLADLSNPANVEEIHGFVRSRLPQDVLRRTTVFMLRGGIDYSKLTLDHRMVMDAIYMNAKTLPAEKRTDDANRLVENYGKAADFVDLSRLAPIVEALGEESIGRFEFVKLTDRPKLAKKAAAWFAAAWDGSEEEYLAEMNAAIAGDPVKQWYLALLKDRIVSGCGEIVNDHHDHTDLAPNLCKVYTDPLFRMRGLGKRVIELAVADNKARGIDTLYLITDQRIFFERCGFEYYCMGQVEGLDHLSRIYVHH